MAQFTVNTHRFDPYRGFLFQVVMDGNVVAGVSKVGALKRTTEVVSHREGNSISHQIHSPGSTAHDAIMLERGVTHDLEFLSWANSTYNVGGLAGVSLRDFRKDIRINVMNLQGTIAISYKVFRCWVSEYVALPELDANNNAVMIESITCQNDGWELDTDVTEPTEF